jgi:hypothetical protein
MKWQQQSFLFSRLIQSMQYQKGASFVKDLNHAIQQARVGPTAHANAYISQACWMSEVPVICK